MHFFTYAQKDASIYSGSVQGSSRKLIEQNTGLDYQQSGPPLRGVFNRSRTDMRGQNNIIHCE